MKIKNKKLIYINYVNYIINIKSKNNYCILNQYNIYFDLSSLSEKELLWVIISYKIKQKKQVLLLVNKLDCYNTDSYSDNLNINLNYLIWCYFYGLFLIENL